jgi:hypothetical protein
MEIHRVNNKIVFFRPNSQSVSVLVVRGREIISQKDESTWKLIHQRLSQHGNDFTEV